jgi:hypothetical protein
MSIRGMQRGMQGRGNGPESGSALPCRPPDRNQTQPHQIKILEILKINNDLGDFSCHLP